MNHLSSKQLGKSYEEAYKEHAVTTKRKNATKEAIAKVEANFNAKSKQSRKPIDIATREEKIADLASTLENTISDFLPDSDRDIPVQIARAVATQVIDSMPSRSEETRGVANQIDAVARQARQELNKIEKQFKENHYGYKHHSN